MVVFVVCSIPSARSKFPFCASLRFGLGVFSFTDRGFNRFFVDLWFVDTVFGAVGANGGSTCVCFGFSSCFSPNSVLLIVCAKGAPAGTARPIAF